MVFSPFFVDDYWMGFPRFFTQHHRCQVICTDFHGKFQLSYHSFISVAEQWIQKKKPKVGKSVCIETNLMKFQIATRLLSRSQDAFVSSSFCQCYRRLFWFSLGKLQQTFGNSGNLLKKLVAVIGISINY